MTSLSFHFAQSVTFTYFFLFFKYVFKPVVTGAKCKILKKKL